MNSSISHSLLVATNESGKDRLFYQDTLLPEKERSITKERRLHISGQLVMCANNGK